MKKFIILFAVAILLVSSQPFYNYIIVGAGWAGLGACAKLKAAGATNILILEAKNRTGGRTTSFTYNGVELDLGTSFVQNPGTDNSIDQLVISNGYTKVPGWFGNETNWYVNKSKVSASSLTDAQNLYNINFTNYWNSQFTSPDQPLSNVLKNFWKSTSIISNTTQAAIFTRAKVNQTLQSFGIYKGAESTTMSTYEYLSSPTSNNDYTVTPSLSNFFQYMFTKSCSGTQVQLNLNEAVTSIDYSRAQILITTNKGSYRTRKTLISPSLGILQASLKGWTNATTIRFNPALTTTYQNAINSIGFGISQKLYVTFASKFWDTTSSTLHFTCKVGPCLFTKAWVVPNVANTVVFSVVGNEATKLVTTPLDTIKTQLTNTLSQFLSSVPSITNIFMTNWLQDKNVLGGFSYAKVGITTNHFSSLKKPIIGGGKYLWFIGQGTHPTQYSTSHGAYNSGVDAATAALTAL